MTSTTQRIAAACADKGVDMLDAPVSGGPKGAANGTLGMLLGGDDATLERVMPMLEAMSAKRTHVGGPGSGGRRSGRRLGRQKRGGTSAKR